MLAHFTHKDVATFLHVVGTTDLGKERTDLRASRRRFHDVQPVARRRSAFLGENFHAVAHLQLIGKRHNGTVDLRANTVVAHFRMNGESEIDRS